MKNKGDFTRGHVLGIYKTIKVTLLTSERWEMKVL
jgi:hypothetical protein